jgi:predicted component of type VI protein secretion system
MRFRLRYLQHDLELSEGQFAVGRNASCQLSLDDPLVSRRHALLTVSEDSVLIEDLQSRNGVLVNGARIDGRVPLRAGDRILVGAQELTLLHARETGHMTTNSSQQARAAKMTLPKMAAAVRDMTEEEQSSSSLKRMRREVQGARSEAEAEPSMVRRADAFRLLGGVAEKALVMGRAAEAERLLASPLADVIEASRAGKPMPPSLVDQAAKFSAKLATATGKGGWADYVIELYAAQGRPPPAPVIDELYTAMRKVTAIDITRLRHYIEDLRGTISSFGPADRFLFQRLEGLERLAALR